METTRVEVDGGDVELLGVCQGLDGEADAAVDALEAREPSVVALALAPEVAPQVDEIGPADALGAEDEVYMEGLSEWGDVRLPAPAYPAALEAAERLGARVEGVDMERADYLDRHLDRIGTFQMLKRALRVRWLSWWPPSADSPGAFCRAFDERLNDGPYGRLQLDRERSMAANLTGLAADERVSCVVEVERLDGLTRALRGPDRRDR